MWTPDVYEGSPTPITAFFSVAPKIAAMGLLIRLLLEPFGFAFDQWQQVIVVVSIASMVIGVFGALKQKNIKRLMAYSAISHIGFMLVGLAAGSEEGIRGILIYLSIYLVMNIGIFACIIMMREHDNSLEEIDDFKGLAITHPLRAVVVAILMFSLAGIPPLAGFFGKFYIFISAIHAGLYTLAIIGVLASVVAAYYYVRIVKLMYFDEPIIEADKEYNFETRGVAVVSSLFNLVFFVFPVPLILLVESVVKVFYA